MHGNGRFLQDFHKDFALLRVNYGFDSRTLGRLADTREYQNDCEDSRFYMMKRNG